MSLPPLATLKGWQPLTPRGVAAFARGSLKRLLLVQFVFAALTAAATVWFLSSCWFPVIDTAIRQLPTQGQIRSGQLDWFGPSPQLLAESSFLALVVDLNHSGQAHSPAQIQIEFGRNTIQILSVFGYVECAYPISREQIIGFNRPALEPWWGAWKPPISWAGVALMMGGLLLYWTGLATVNSFIVRLIGFFANRDLALRASWKLAGAAWMPAALLLAAAIVLHGLDVLDLVGFMFCVAAQVLVGWFYTLFSPLFAPKLSSSATPSPNPFVAPPG